MSVTDGNGSDVLFKLFVYPEVATPLTSPVKPMDKQ